MKAYWWPRDFVGVKGPDAGSFLQGQLSQDVLALEPPGGRAWSWLLQPTGKVDALLRVHRLTDDAFVLETDEGFGEAVARRLERFKLRTKADIEALPDFRCLTVRGADAPDVDPLPGLPGWDEVGPDVTERDDVPTGTAEEWEAVRIRAGIPRMGAELTEATIPGEAGPWWIEHAVSFTKGCYTGQELVARIDSRGGHVPRPVRVLEVDGAVPPVGATVVGPDGKEVGALTSVAATADGAVALAPVARSVESPADVVVRWEDGERPARLAAPPLVS